jgi:hypothetical protein
MKHLAIALALGLTGCATTTVPVAPVEVADRVGLDEQGALSAELAYKAARTAVELGVDAGVIRGERATQIAALDRKAYSALTAVRAAYRAGNAASYSAALTEARTAITTLLALTGR